MIEEQDKTYSKKEIFKILHPWVRQWFDSQFEDFTPAQKKSIMDIHKNNNILISSPTGSGKTLTAFLSVISELTTLAEADKLEDKVETVAVKSPDEKLLANIMKAINDHLDDDSLTMDLIASEVGLSRVHLNRKMKDLTGQTPHDFIRKVRLKKAAELLASGKMNVSEVTYTCGFSSPTSFSALFKKFYGVSPSQYYKSKTE